LSQEVVATGTQELVFADQTSNLGASRNLAANLLFNGGVLQYNGTSGSTDRSFTINSEAIWDIGNATTVLMVGGDYATAGAEDIYRLTKRGAGVMDLRGRSFGGFGLEQLIVEDGTLRLSPTFSDQYVRNDVGGLVLAGGALDLSGVNGRATTQNMIGAFSLMEGASEIRVTATGNQNSILNLQDANLPQPVSFARGSTVHFHENQSLTGSGEARITLAGRFGVDVQVVIPRATYSTNIDFQQPGVNNFAFVDASAFNVIGSDSGAAAHTIQADVANWTGFMNVQDGALDFDAFQGITVSGASVNTIRYFNSSYTANAPGTSIVTITDLLAINGGALLQTTHAGNHQNLITGGTLTTGLINADGVSADLIIHNWNPVRALQIESIIADNGATSRKLNLIHAGNGTTAISAINTFTGDTHVQGGVLRIDHVFALPFAGHVRLDGGVIGLNAGDFNRPLGTGSGDIDWTSSGGFAAYSAPRLVNIGSGASLTWGAGGFVPDNTSLILGAQDSDSTLVFSNNIDFGRKSRMVEVLSGRSSVLVDARLSGAISGEGGSLVKAGSGVLEITGSNTYTGGTFLARGTLVVSSAAAIGTGTVHVGATTDTTSPDLLLNLTFNGGALANSVVFGGVNREGVSIFGGTSALSTISGTVAIERAAGRNVLLILPSGANTVLSGAISGTGGLTLSGGGQMTFSGTNTYGSLSGGTGVAIDGATVIRHGVLSLGASGSLTGAVIELGDATTSLSIVDYATTGASVMGVENEFSIIANNRSSLGGVFVHNADGTLDGVGSPNVGQGAFYNVSSSQGGHVFDIADVGKRLLVKDEIDHPERNGVYEVVAVNSNGTMNITRSSDFNSVSNMLYGAQLTVVNGTASGTYFMAAPNVSVVNAAGADPVYFLADTLNPNVTLSVTSPTVNSVVQAIDINANGTGSTSIVASSAVTFSGNVTLQNVQPGVQENKALTLNSSASGAGMVLSGILSESTLGSGPTDDILSLIKSGTGVVTLSGANTYKGGTTVSSGSLLLTNTSGSATGSGAVTVLSGATLGGTGAVAPAAGANITISSGASLNVGLSGALMGEALAIQLQAGSSLQLAGALRLDLFSNQAGSTAGEVDRLIFSGASTVNITGSSLFVSNVNNLAPASFNVGDTWQLIDWAGLSPTGTFSNLSGTFTSNFTDLPDLGAGRFWDISHLYSQGTIVVAVPEPGRLVLLVLGLMGLFGRRRRRHWVEKAGIERDAGELGQN
jgi:autotransporter-associated beta strand protein